MRDPAMRDPARRRAELLRRLGAGLVMSEVGVSEVLVCVSICFLQGSCEGFNVACATQVPHTYGNAY